jgi:hypothetical protein
MYAVATRGLVYHLGRNHKILCGLFVVGVKSETDSTLGPLHPVTEKPSDRISLPSGVTHYVELGIMGAMPSSGLCRENESTMVFGSNGRLCCLIDSA